jgi:hypothetical protein
MRTTARTTSARTRPIRMSLAALGVAALGTAAVVPAQAEEVPEHGHVLLVGVEVLPGSFPPVATSVVKCVDLAHGQKLPNHAHHEHLMNGSAGDALSAHTGNQVVPVAPFPDPFNPGEVMPWSDCAGLLAFFGIED